eukprot:gene109-2350_t
MDASSSWRIWRPASAGQPACSQASSWPLLPWRPVTLPPPAAMRAAAPHGRAGCAAGMADECVDHHDAMHLHQLPGPVHGSRLGRGRLGLEQRFGQWSSATPMDNGERQLTRVQIIKQDPSTAPYTKMEALTPTVTWGAPDCSTAVVRGQSFRDCPLDDYMFNEVGASELVDRPHWDDTCYAATMLVLINRTLAASKVAWQLLSQAQVQASPPATCKADLAGFCQPGALVQSRAMYCHCDTKNDNPLQPKHPWTNCSFGYMCKGAADYYGIGNPSGSFGCADKGAQNWWVHEAQLCASPESCCTAGKPAPYPRCTSGPPSGPLGTP